VVVAPTLGIPRAALLAGLLMLALAAPALAQGAGSSVALAGLMGQRALLVVNGKPPKGVAPGETHLGVKVVSVGDGQALLEIDGKRHMVRLGEAPVSVGTNRNEGAGGRVVLTAGSGGHFIADGQINGRAARLMVDTGASLVVISAAEAAQIGISFRNGQQTRLSTANGVATGWLLKLDSVRVGDITLFGVDAVVSPEPLPFVLLGNSFLSRFQMNRENDQLTLSRRF
jgi:aspartyl protease family protein